MIAHLQGKIIKRTDKGIILSTGSIGYFVHLTKNIVSEMKEGTEAEFFIHANIKEDSQELYGFSIYQELEFFTKLLNINGIGPKVALEITNVPSDKIKSAILSEDEAFICKIPGIGKKTAKRIILELKDKIDLEDTMLRDYSPISAKTHQEALEALIGLGFDKRQISSMLSELPDEIVKTEEIITYFLKNS